MPEKSETKQQGTFNILKSKNESQLKRFSHLLPIIVIAVSMHCHGYCYRQLHERHQHPPRQTGLACRIEIDTNRTRSILFERNQYQSNLD